MTDVKLNELVAQKPALQLEITRVATGLSYLAERGPDDETHLYP